LINIKFISKIFWIFWIFCITPYILSKTGIFLKKLDITWKAGHYLRNWTLSQKPDITSITEHYIKNWTLPQKTGHYLNKRTLPAKTHITSKTEILTYIYIYNINNNNKPNSFINIIYRLLNFISIILFL
jgi:hypothetical protein